MTTLTGISAELKRRIDKKHPRLGGRNGHEKQRYDKKNLVNPN
jgi:hypothetical protein